MIACCMMIKVRTNTVKVSNNQQNPKEQWGAGCVREAQLNSNVNY